MVRTPLMYTRIQAVEEGKGVISNTMDGEERVSYIVVLPFQNDEHDVSTGWMKNPDFPEGEIRQAGIDLLDAENTYIFDDDDEMVSYRKALLKMKELWAALEVPQL